MSQTRKEKTRQNNFFVSYGNSVIVLSTTVNDTDQKSFNWKGRHLFCSELTPRHSSSVMHCFKSQRETQVNLFPIHLLPHFLLSYRDLIVGNNFRLWPLLMGSGPPREASPRQCRLVLLVGQIDCQI